MGNPQFERMIETRSGREANLARLSGCLPLRAARLDSGRPANFMKRIMLQAIEVDGICHVNRPLCATAVT
jgi:hypothetical protein